MKKPNKFNSESDLAEAYAALEVEFTKRCQKIKELEALLEKAEERRHDGGDSASNSAKDLTAEVSEGNITSEGESAAEESRLSRVEDGVELSSASIQDKVGGSEVPCENTILSGAREGESSTPCEPIKSDNGKTPPLLHSDDNLIKPSDIKEYVATAVREAIAEMQQSQATEPAAPSLAQAQAEAESEDEAFAAIISSDKVKRAVIAEYLSALKERNGFEAVKGRVVLTPPSRPTSLEEAKRIIDGLVR